MWMMCRKLRKGRQLPGRVMAFFMAVLLEIAVLPVSDAMTAQAAGGERPQSKTKNSVQLQIGGKKVTKKTYRMKEGTKKKLKVVAKKTKSVRYRSSKKKVASVSKKGVIQAKKAGTAKIAAAVKTSRGKKTVWMKVKVVSSGKDTKPEETKKPSGTEQPTVTVPPSETARPDTTSAAVPTNTPGAEVTPNPTETQTPPVSTVTPNPAETQMPPVSTGTPAPTGTPSGGDGGKILIAYFTWSGNAETLADMIQEKTGGTKFRIETVKVYPEDYSGVYDEAMTELQENARPELKTRVDNMAEYDTVLIGYPIWHGNTPMAIRSFLESYDFTGKKVIPFCSSASSRPETSFASVSESASGAEVLAGFWTREANVANAAGEVNQWIDGLGILQKSEEEVTMGNQINIAAGDTVFTATLADNSSVEALKGLLRQGPLTIHMRDYASMEKVGPIGTSLPTNDEHIVTGAGDIILYQGNSLVIYYDTNTWNFTRIGKIEGVTKEQLLAAMGNGDVTVTITLGE